MGQFWPVTHTFSLSRSLPRSPSRALPRPDRRLPAHSRAHNASRAPAHEPHSLSLFAFTHPVHDPLPPRQPAATDHGRCQPSLLGHISGLGQASAGHSQASTIGRAELSSGPPPHAFRFPPRHASLSTRPCSAMPFPARPVSPPDHLAHRAWQSSLAPHAPLHRQVGACGMAMHGRRWTGMRHATLLVYAPASATAVGPTLVFRSTRSRTASPLFLLFPYSPPNPHVHQQHVAGDA